MGYKDGKKKEGKKPAEWLFGDRRGRDWGKLGVVNILFFIFIF